jgi:tRNA modification GTPase
VEAGIDFSDEGDVSEELMAPALLRVDVLKSEIKETLAASAQSERLREGLQVAIAGPPNAGKSTLLNRLARREAAIVSPHAGTTRDVIEVHLDLDGYPVTLIDTAGLRETNDPVEQEGVRRARVRAETADLVLWMCEADGDVPPFADGAPLWVVRNKIDLAAMPIEGEVGFAISATTGQGVDALVSALVGFAQDFFGGGEAALVSRARHRSLLTETVAALERAGQRAEEGDEIVAEELRIAIHALGRLLGRVDVEEILDSIFREFCIGK